MVKTLKHAISLVCDTARGGALAVLAPAKSFQSVFNAGSSSDLAAISSSDGGYMTGRLRGYHISEPGFADAFGDFTAHSDNDRWPDDHPDVNARKQLKDGALLLNEEGYCLKCAVKVGGLGSP